MMNVVETIKSTKLIAIARGIYGDELIKAAFALYNAGVRAFEVTFEQDKPFVRSYDDTVRPYEIFSETVNAIVRLYESLPEDAVIGAGTVLTAEQVRMAFDAGAKFIISPNTDREVIEETKRFGLVSVPGAMTPTEIVAAYGFGADIVKVFPAGNLGVEYFKALKAPLAHIPLAAVAGITPGNITEFDSAGAVAFGISSGLFDKAAIKRGDYDSISSRARDFYLALNR